ncbi:MAG: sulfatase-like hydrolase/transferase [Phycisphaeraceae bacterium]
MPDRPNIILILTDQHRLSAMGCYGETPCRTPHLDRLAERGTRFETVYTTCPLCSPARGSVMTGTWPHRHGITANTNNLTAACHFVRDHPSLLPRQLQAQGYRTGYTGKWHLGDKRDEMVLGKYPVPWPEIESLPRDFGFDGQNFSGHGAGGFQYEEYKQYLRDNGWSHDKENGELTGPVESTVPHFLTSHTMSLVDQYAEGEEPFFIWHNFWGPHGPYLATKEFNDLYRDADIPPWPNFDWPSRNIPGPHQAKIHPEAESMTWDGHWKRQVQRYYAFTTMIDAEIGRLLDHLEQRGIADNTVILFAADHGETCGSHGGLTDKGFHHFEEIQRIPLIVSGPGVERGAVRQELVSLADFMPTICDLAGGDPTMEPIQGRSLAPLLRGENVSDWREDVVVEFDGLNHAACTLRTLRRGPYKYGLNIAHEDELYDLDADPWEKCNLIRHPGYQEVARTLRSRMFEWLQEADDQALAALRTKQRYYEAQPR